MPRKMQNSYWFSICLIFAIILSACSPAATATTAPQATSTPQPTQPVVQATEPPSTATTAPTATAVSTATAAPTQTPLPPTETPSPTTPPALGVAQDGLSAWCLPEDSLIQDLDPVKPPEYARYGVITNGALDLKNVPYNGCMFIYNLNQAVPAGVKLEIYDLNQKQPWFTAELKPVDGKPEMGYAFVRHSYIINPPVWHISFTLVLRDSSGNALRSDQLNLQRPYPKLCWNGQLPYLKTLSCPLQQDLHPWDPSYRTPFPTPEPQ